MNPELLRRLPKMDLLLARPALAEHPLPYPVKRQAARQVLDDCRRALREGAELVHTLQLYLLDTDRSVTQTAQALFVHKNTVKYRLQQLGARLGHPVAKFPEAFGLYTACAVERLLEG